METSSLRDGESTLTVRALKNLHELKPADVPAKQSLVMQVVKVEEVQNKANTKEASKIKQK